MTIAPLISRRTLLGLGLGAAATTAFGGMFLVINGTPGARAAHIVRHALRDVRFDEAGLQRFIHDEDRIMTGQWNYNTKMNLLYHSQPFWIWAPLFASAPLKIRAQRLERHTLSRFLFGSDFFYVDIEKDIVTYTGEPTKACSNPFARAVEE